MYQGPCAVLLLVLVGIAINKNSIFVWRTLLLIGVPGKARNRKKERYDDIHNNTVYKYLYIATSLSDYYSGDRPALCGSDQLKGTLIPTMVEIVHSFLQSGYKVGVLFICHFPLVPTQSNMVQRALPDHVGITFWDNATPIQYPCDLSSPPKALLWRTLPVLSLACL
jgi:hypothetical protein